MKIHPLADLFPMMGEDDLADLAADIKANGLLHPIVVDADGILVDGRNRLRACEIAGITPAFEQLNGHDPAAFIVSANLARRNLTKGQQAMALAMIYPEPASLRRKGAGVSETQRQNVSQARLSQARSVLRHSRALAEDVLAGREHLDAALKQVRESEQTSKSHDVQMAELRAHASDLADLVTEERLTLAEAYSAMAQRRAEAEAAETNKRETILGLAEASWNGITAWAAPDFVADVESRLTEPEFRALWLKRVRNTRERFAEIKRGAKAFSDLLAGIAEERTDV